MKPLSNIPDILKRIIEAKQDEVAALKRESSVARFAEEAAGVEAPRGFLNSLKTRAAETQHTALIAEVKKASPSKGIIREDFDPVWIGEQYAVGGAACLSVLTDEQFFQGALRYLTVARDASGLPVLRKDFIIDRLQLHQARAAGADAVLLIAACLDPHHLADLHAEATEGLGVDVLVEVHDEFEWEAVCSASPPPPLVGINNRNLRDFTVTLETTKRVAPEITQAGCFLVAESGIFTPADVAFVRDAGAGAILVGESLMRQADVAAAVRALLAK